MELELRQDYISCWDTVYDAHLELEETSEMIVPDACPDILQVLDAEGKIFLQRKEVLDGRVEFSGLIRANILYLPEGHEKVHALDAVLPFDASVDLPAINRLTQTHVVPQIQNIDVHLLNPRKILLRVNFTLKILCNRPETLSLATGVEERGAYGIEQQLGEYRSLLTVGTQEKTFHYSDVLSLPAGRPNVKKLLRSRGTCLCNETKIVGSKLVFKGDAQLELLYSGEDGELYHSNFTLPFSQLMEVFEVGEDAQTKLSLIYTDMECKLADEEGASLSVELELLAQVTFSRNEQRELLTDLYSTDYNTQVEERSYSVYRLMDQGSAPETVREVIATDLPALSVLDVQVRPGHLTRNKENGVLNIGAEVEVYILYETEQSGIDSVHRSFIVPHQIPIADNWDYQCQFQLLREPIASPVSGGIELTFTLDYAWRATAKESMNGVEQVSLEERVSEEGVQRPSVVLRTVQPGDSLWKIGKENCTTVEEIMEANDLHSIDIYPGQILILPKKQDRAC